ncbi:hypothetical protein PM082_018043 [Marasmius tenuissimus]|nr:hypothetical protein PM082_018043 [Marasmius tenuissimus]
MVARPELPSSSDALPERVAYGTYSATLIPLIRKGTDELAGIPLLEPHPSFARTSMFPPADNIPTTLTSRSWSFIPPITRLPDKILSYIFILAHYRDEPPSSEFTNMNPFHGGAFPWILSTVCLRWHLIAITTKELWQKISVCTEAEYFSQIWPNGGALRKWVSFAVNRPPGFGLDVYLKTPKSEFSSLDTEVVIMLLEHARYFRTLRLECPPHGLEVFAMKGVDVPLLEALHVSFPCGDDEETRRRDVWLEEARQRYHSNPRWLFRSCPRLKFVHIEEMCLPFIVFSIPFDQLDTLHLTYCSFPHEWVKWGIATIFCAGSARPVRIDLHQSVHSASDREALLGARLCNSSIEKLEYRAPKDDIFHVPNTPNERSVHIFDRLILPNLKELIIRDDAHPGSFYAYLDLVGRSDASLTRLTIYGVLWRDRSLHQFFYFFGHVQSTLESLTLGVNPSEAVSRFKTFDFIYSYALPRLKELRFVIRPATQCTRLGNYLRSNREKFLRNLLNIVSTRWVVPMGYRGFGGYRKKSTVPTPPTPLERCTVCFHTSDFDVEVIRESILRDFDRGNVKVLLERVEDEAGLAVYGCEEVLSSETFAAL